MKKKTIEGTCHICGKKTKLTFEHIPPYNAFNFTPAKVIQGDEAIKLITDNKRLPWDTTNLKYKNQQKGMGAYTLCEKCNNLTGSLYGNTYCITAKSIFKLMVENELVVNTSYSIHINNIKMARFSRQVLSMFCSTCPCLTEKYPEIKNVLLKGKKYENPPFKIKVYLLNNNKISFTGIMAMLVKDIGIKTIAQIDAFPFLFILEIDNQTDIYGWDITEYLTMDIDKVINEDVIIRLIEHNTNFPCDFRSKEIIEKNSFITSSN